MILFRWGFYIHPIDRPYQIFCIHFLVYTSVLHFPIIALLKFSIELRNNKSDALYAPLTHVNTA